MLDVDVDACWASTYNLCLFKQTCKEGEAVCAAQVRVAWDIIWKQDRLSQDQAFRLRSKYPNIDLTIF